MPATFRFGAAELHPATRQLLIAGVPAALGARAFDLLLALIERRDRLVAKQELLDVVWRGQVVEEGNLHVQVSTLRKLLGPAAITTVPGRGFRFVAVLEGATDPADGGTAEPSPPGLAARGNGNVAASAQPLFGREAALRALQAQIEAHRLVTIIGSSGMGKTSLALAAADALRERWRDGVWFVELASVADPARVAHAVAMAMRISLPGAASEAEVLDHLVGVLGSMSMLLVLDNCEHLLDAAGALAERLLAQAPGVRMLATSQELLNVRGEALHKLDPLAVPAADVAPLEAPQYSAIQLFCERARAAHPTFALTSDNAQAVADICRRLDGLPLAIELAAARVRLLGVHGLRDRLGERFRVLTGGARTAMRRHQTLHAAIDWSHALLSEPEQVVLRRLAVFVGGFALELAQAVALDAQLDEWAVLEALSALVDKSLVIADVAEPPRYRLLETTRAYALEKLAAAGETDAWIQRHAQAVCAFFERTEENRRGENATLSNVDFVRRLAPEIDNARAALAWAGGHAGDLNLAVGLAATLAQVQSSVGLAAQAIEGLSALQDRLDATVDPARAARLWYGLLVLGQSSRRPLLHTLEAAARAGAFYRTAGMPRRLASVLTQEAQFRALAGDVRSAQELLGEVGRLEGARPGASGWPAWMIGERLAAQGWIHMVQGELEQALSVHREQHALMREAPGERRGLIFSVNNVCRDLCLLGRFDECIVLAQSVIQREGGPAAGSVGLTCLLLVLAQVASGRIAEAGQSASEALPGWRRNGVVRVAGAVMAVLLAERGRWADAVRVGAAALSHARRAGMERSTALKLTRERLQALLDAAPCSSADVERWQGEGEWLDDAAIEAICLRATELAPELANATAPDRGPP